MFSHFDVRSVRTFSLIYPFISINIIYNQLTNELIISPRKNIYLKKYLLTWMIFQVPGVGKLNGLQLMWNPEPLGTGCTIIGNYDWPIHQPTDRRTCRRANRLVSLPITFVLFRSSSEISGIHQRDWNHLLKGSVDKSNNNNEK